MFKFLTVSALLIGVSACSKTPQESPEISGLETVWITEGFEAPESLIPSHNKSFFYVSNVNGDAAEKDGNGYISLLSEDGTRLDEKWATGLDAPKGLALVDSKLYVTDIDRLVEIDTETGSISNTYPAPDAKFLNDVAYIEGFGVFASDSASQSIYRLQDGAMVKWIESEQLSGVNGLQGDGNNVLVTTMSAGDLLSINLDNKSITKLATGMNDADGIAVLGNGQFIISSWPGQIHHVSANGNTKIILETIAENINMNDLYYDGDLIYVPNWQPGTIRAYKIK